jgi:hypothetical protein
MKVRLWARGIGRGAGTDTARWQQTFVRRGAQPGVCSCSTPFLVSRPLGKTLASTPSHPAHEHMDHIRAGFFAPLFHPNVETHLWGPPAPGRARKPREIPLAAALPRTSATCRARAARAPRGEFVLQVPHLGERVCHPGSTVGYRIASNGAVMAYLSDHEPALGVPSFPQSAEWTSGYGIARDVDLLVHDSQYSRAEYGNHVGWGHSAIDHALAFAGLVRARRLVTFHHDPAHDDWTIERITKEATLAAPPPSCDRRRRGRRLRRRLTPSRVARRRSRR